MIVVGGDNLIDLIESARSDGVVSFTGARGGSGYNTARAVARQQQVVGFITPIAMDNLGHFLADKMLADGVELLGPRSEKPSSLAVVTLIDGQPSYQFYRDDTAERQVDLPFLQNNFPAKGRAFHLTSLAIIDGSDADAWADFFAEQHRMGIVTTLDPNVRPMLIADREAYLERLWRLMNTADILKLSDEDLEWIFPNLDFDTACTAVLRTTSAKLSIVTKGAKGAICYCNGLKVVVPAHPVPKLVDTVGAGDTFMATVLSHLNSADLLSQDALTGLDQATLIALLTRAAKAAAINCECEGCQPPTADALN
jgi:fructokinase